MSAQAPVMEFGPILRALPYGDESDVCLNCGGRFIGGVVGMTPWPAHVCPDGTRNAEAEMDDWMSSPPTEPAPTPAAPPSGESESAS